MDAIPWRLPLQTTRNYTCFLPVNFTAMVDWDENVAPRIRGGRPKGTMLTEVCRTDGTCDSCLTLTPNIPETNGDWFRVQWNGMECHGSDERFAFVGRRKTWSLVASFQFWSGTQSLCYSKQLGRMGLGCHAVLDNVILGTGGWRIQKVVYWQACRLGKLIKLDRNHQVQLRIPIQGSRNMHFVAANGRERSSYHSMEGAERADQDAMDDL
eukprot:scaffold18833_cov55-Attheya_sp.AAC.1